jgi:hypothetical protein
MDPVRDTVIPQAFVAYARRTDSGRPTSGRRFSARTAILTLLARRASVRNRSASPITPFVSIDIDLNQRTPVVVRRFHACRWRAKLRHTKSTASNAFTASRNSGHTDNTEAESGRNIEPNLGHPQSPLLSTRFQRAARTPLTPRTRSSLCIAFPRGLHAGNARSDLRQNRAIM